MSVYARMSVCARVSVYVRVSVYARVYVCTRVSAYAHAYEYIDACSVGVLVYLSLTTSLAVYLLYVQCTPTLYTYLTIDLRLVDFLG